jgi:hypothetical protein
MTVLTIQLTDHDYERLQKMAEESGRTVQDVIQDWIAQMPHAQPLSGIDITQDPIYQFEGYDSDAPTDLAENLDKYLYRVNIP